MEICNSRNVMIAERDDKMANVECTGRYLAIVWGTALH